MVEEIETYKESWNAFLEAHKDVLDQRDEFQTLAYMMINDDTIPDKVMGQYRKEYDKILKGDKDGES